MPTNSRPEKIAMRFRFCKRCVTFTPHDDRGSNLKCRSCGRETPQYHA